MLASVAFDPDRRVEKLRDYAAKAASSGAKLVKACCSGVRFVDPATQCLMQPTRYRTLEGIAEISDAALARGEPERLVERIP
jgi:hypothetical protein